MAVYWHLVHFSSENLQQPGDLHTNLLLAERQYVRRQFDNAMNLSIYQQCSCGHYMRWSMDTFYRAVSIDGLVRPGVPCTYAKVVVSTMSKEEFIKTMKEMTGVVTT
jgi:hypothetical protein